MNRANQLIGLAVPLAALVAGISAGCTGDLLANLTEERGDDITVIFINDTAHRASFTFGTFYSLRRDPPNAPDWQQQRLEAKTSTEPIALDCRNQMAIGTEEFIQRAIDTDVPDADGFDADAFAAVVHFSSAPSDSPAAALPTVGTAEGLEVNLGVDYSCGDQLIFTFVEDAAAAGGFRIEYRLLRTGADE